MPIRSKTKIECSERWPWKHPNHDAKDWQIQEVSPLFKLCQCVWQFSRYYDIDVDPCTKYVVKVQASEDYQVEKPLEMWGVPKDDKMTNIFNFQGRREDFKAVSLEVHHKVKS